MIHGDGNGVPDSVIAALVSIMIMAGIDGAMQALT
jgi:hypothetical protein